MSACPCGSDKEYASCCEVYIEGKEKAPTPEALMRSRYSAFVVGDVDYIMKTISPSKRKETDDDSIRQWSEGSEWYGLEIRNCTGGGENDKTGTVEFVASYEADEKARNHHEIAQFRKERGQWYFYDGEIQQPEPFKRDQPKVQRNDACPCGSGKKYKKCCGKVGSEATEA